MRPVLWQPPVAPTAAEQAIIKRIRRAKLFVFLREHRHDLFNEAFQEVLATLYRDSLVGQPPTRPPNSGWQPSYKPIPGPLMMK